VPTNASVAYATGAIINVQQIGAGQVTIQGDTGVTLTSTGATATTPKTRAQYSAASIIKTGTDSWTVIGDIA
jgi:sarcosine oxidase gamma subunit